MNQLQMLEEHGYMRDREPRLRELCDMNMHVSLAFESANQIKHLKEVLKKLVSAVENKGLDDTMREIENAKVALDA